MVFNTDSELCTVWAHPLSDLKVSFKITVTEILHMKDKRELKSADLS